MVVGVMNTWRFIKLFSLLLYMFKIFHNNFYFFYIYRRGESGVASQLNYKYETIDLSFSCFKCHILDEVKSKRNVHLLHFWPLSFLALRNYLSGGQDSFSRIATWPFPVISACALTVNGRLVGLEWTKKKVLQHQDLTPEIHWAQPWATSVQEEEMTNLPPPSPTVFHSSNFHESRTSWIEFLDKMQETKLNLNFR